MFGRSVRESSDTARRSGIVSMIGADMKVSGDVATEDELRVDGRIDGNVRCGSLDLGDGGTITGDIACDEARIAGTVHGKVDARVVVLEAGAKVTGDVQYESLAIAAGARVDGRLGHRDGAAAAPARPVPRTRASKGGAVAELFPQAAE
jgi:cytoskeletal protein CcmA (bactofilin family)